MASYRTFRSSFIAYSEVLAVSIFWVLYIGAFYIVSLWEMYPGVSANALPTYALDGALILIGFSVGYELTFRQIVKSLTFLAWLVIAYTIAQWLLEPDRSRFGANIISLMLLPAVVATRKPFVTVCLAITMLGSRSLTNTAAGFAATAAYLLLYYRGDINRLIRNNSTLLAVTVTLGGVGGYVARGYLYGTLQRFLMHDDPLRKSISENSWQMLWNSNFWGIGYMNFYSWYGQSTGYRSVGRTGLAIEGVNLHNSYMTWALEGGVLVCIVITWLCYLTFKRIRVIGKSAPLVGSLLGAWFVAFAILALYHQLHMSMQFWTTIGLVWGIHAKLRYCKTHGLELASLRFP